MNTVASYLKVNGDLPRETLSLLSFVCKRDVSWIISRPEYKLNRLEIKLLDSLLKRLGAGEPLAYLRGYQDFHKYRFKVSPAVLIPRPESEIIIEAGLNFANTQEPAFFIDLGTGSGALILTLATEMKREQKRVFKNSEYLAGDISAPALKVAKENAKKYGLVNKIGFKRGDLILPFIKTVSKDSRALFIAANLPYLTPQEARNEASIAFEPKTALVGGRDGLSLYRRLLKQVRTLKARPFYLIMEINPQQATTLIRISKAAFKNSVIQKVPDLSGRTRFISIRNN
ncbi:MAG: peptide chain release factor N(5)-glutamine methyltransferase [bacterium]|nr:peptide chain release factor N(5)-glutamine methyltransferase [bacterium]